MTANMAGDRSGKSGASGWKTAALIVAFTAVGYLAAIVAERVPRQLPGVALESRMTTGTVPAGGDNAPGAAAVASLPAPAEQPDYFPDHYVNHAMQVDDQPPTF
jgi:hypothetical protein